MSGPLEHSGKAEADPSGTAVLRVLGDFELRREIGRGGMGTVYEAWQRSLQRIVALKVLGGHVSGSRAAVQRFQREAQAAAKLHHTHIVPIFAQGEDNGVYFYAMEFVEGTSLHAILSATRDRQSADTETIDLMETVLLPRTSTPAKLSGGSGSFGGRGQAKKAPELDSTVTVLKAPEINTSVEHFGMIAEHTADVADALEYAHQRGVIHRDIKPHNLMLGRDGRLRVSDFGLARLAEQPAVTITGEMLGSPMYMSPEQILEGPSKVDARTDVYSLGVTLYEWLTLKPPFPGETRESVISKIIHAEPIPPREHNPAIPVDLETICLKATDRDRGRRYQTAGEFRDDLRRFLANRSIKAKRASLASRARKFVARHQSATLTGTAALTILVALGLGVALVRKQRVVKTQWAAVRDLQAEAQGAQEEAKSAQADAQRLLEVLGNVMPVEVGLPKEGAKLATPVVQGLVRSAQGLTGTVKVPAADWAEITPLDTPTALAQRIVRDFYDSARRQDWPEPPTSATDTLAVFLRGALTRRETEPRVAFDFVDGVLLSRPDDFETRQLHAALAGQLGDHLKMHADSEEMVRMQGANANAYIWRALAFLLLGRAEDSLRDLTRALEINGQSAWGRLVHGLALIELGRAPDAISAFNDVVKDSPHLVLAWFALAAARAAAGDHAQAIADITKVVELRPDDAEAWMVRGDYHTAIGDFAAAVRDFEEAMKRAGQTRPLVARWLAAIRQKIQAGSGSATGTTAPPAHRPPPDADAALPDPLRGSSRRLIVDFVASRQ